MEDFAALQQRVADPGKGQGFFDGNTYAPRLDLTRRGDPVEELTTIGTRLADLLFEEEHELTATKAVAHEHIANIAAEVARNNASSQNRRDMAKRCATYLLSLHPEYASFVPSPIDSPEV
jgi:hypothetical protein